MVDFDSAMFQLVFIVLKLFIKFVTGNVLKDQILD